MVADTKQAILIVDDDGLIRFDLVDFFEGSGYCVFEAENAEEAITIMAANPSIRIVLTDIEMPGPMNGINLAHYIRGRYPPTLLVIASGALNPMADELPAGAIFIPKPFDPRFVLRTIERAV